MPAISLYRIPDADLTNESVLAILAAEPSAEIPVVKGIPARLFIFREPKIIPDWAGYVAGIATRPLGIPAREPTGAVLLVKPNERARTVYAATWGIGRFYLKSDRVEPDWGLRCALNLLSGNPTDDPSWNPARVRALRSKRVSQNTLVAEIQSSRKTTIDSFPFSVDVDQLRRVTGTPIDSTQFGATISGGSSIHLKRPENPKSLVKLCRNIERVHNSKDYQRHFSWIDNVSPVTDQSVVSAIYAQMVSDLRNNQLDTLNLSPPTVIQWDTFSKFSFQWGHRTQEVDDPSTSTFRDFLVQHSLLQTLSAEDLRDKPRLHALDDDNTKVQSWPIGRCLSGEFKIKGYSYILDDGTLFLVATDFLQQLNTFIKRIGSSKLPFPETTKNELEEDYNRRVATSLNIAILLDQRGIRRRGASEIEICDIATSQKKLIHVKRGTSSGSLSHLFSQGAVSAELLHMDPEFREEISKLFEKRGKEKIEGSGSSRMKDFKWAHDGSLDPRECEIIYVIMTERPRVIEHDRLPFFSKVNLRMRCHELRRMGYKYSLALVPLGNG